MFGSSITLVPAYGRDYGSAGAARQAWIDGKDFKVAVTGQYCSMRDHNLLPEVHIRYNNLQNKVIIQESDYE